MGQGDSLGDRMKAYEDCSRLYLPKRMPVIIRLDGKAFHTWAAGLNKPYSGSLMDVMDEVTKFLCANVQNCMMAYTQSDEISLLLVNYRTIDTSPWFDNNIQKMVSISSALASAKLTELSPRLFGAVRTGLFDARAFVLPESDVENYFIWRQQDWLRNSIQMLAQSLYSHKQLQGKKTSDLHELCFQKGQNWADYSSHIKNGRVCLKRQVGVPVVFDSSDGTRMIESIFRSEWYVPLETPIFKENRSLIRDLVKPLEKDQEGVDSVA